MSEVAILDKSRQEFFSYYPCEWVESGAYLGESWVLNYKTGSLLGVIEPESDDELVATFCPGTGWTITTESISEGFPSVAEAKAWLEDRVLDFLYPDGWRFQEQHGGRE